MPNNAEAQRKRRLARRRCGGCGGPAAFMRYWHGALVPICAGCAEKLASEGTESNASSQADLEAQMPPAHVPCISLQQLADDLKDTVRPVAAMRAQVRMYRTAATRKRERANREQVRKMMESFEAAHYGGEGATTGGAGARADPARGGGAARRDAGAERDRQGELITWAMLGYSHPATPGRD